MKTMRYLSWLAIAAMMLAGCSTRITPYYPHGGGTTPGGGTPGGGSGGSQPTTQVNFRTDWNVTYEGRTDLEEANERVEEFLINYTGNNYFFLRTLSDEDFASIYNSEVKDLIEGEVKDLNTIAKNKDIEFTKLDGLYTKKVKTLYLDIIVHGEYNLFLIEVDKDGKPTYNYTKTKMEVVEEAQTYEYKTWLGVWTVSDGYVGYDIEISALENNYLYRVDGWETGPAAGDVQMNQDDDWLQTKLLADGTMSIPIQFIASYDNYEDLGDVDYMFVGTYVESTGEKVDDYEGWEVAYADKDASDNYTLHGGSTEYTVNGQTWTTPYSTMRYSLYSYKDECWQHFHSAVPQFTDKNNRRLSMVRTKASSGMDRTPVHTRNYLRKMQPRMHVTRKPNR